jgi:Fe-S cluster assembly protein SufD
MMHAIYEQAIAKAGAITPHWLQPRQQAAAESLQAIPVPGRKSEHWKYAPLSAMAAIELGTHSVQSQPEPTELAHCDDALTLVFSDGVIVNHLSCQSWPAGCSVETFKGLSDHSQSVVDDLLGKACPDRSGLVGCVSEATMTDGVFIDIAANTQLMQPLRIIWHASADCAWQSTRVLVRVADNAVVKIVEQFLAGAKPVSDYHGVTELYVGAGAAVDYCRLNHSQAQQSFLGGVFSRLDRAATLRLFAYAEGGRLCRNEIGVLLAAEGAHAQVDGLYLPKGQEVVDFHTTLEHAAPHCTSEEIFRGIIGDRANAVFNGRIHIHKHAQKTNAQLSNKNLLTSDRAQVNTKPELEIYANDVQCGHGATVSQLDNEAVHYLRTRGVPEDVAVQLIALGFVMALLERMPISELSEWLGHHVKTRCTGLLLGDQ